MTRIIETNATGPVIIKKADIKGDTIAICRCGLSDSPQGLCTGAHKSCQNEKEGSLYVYNRNSKGKLKQVELESEEYDDDDEDGCGSCDEGCECDSDDDDEE